MPKRRLCLAAAGVVAVLLWAPLPSVGADSTEPGGVWVPDLALREPDRPADARDERLLPAPQVPPGGTYALMRAPQDGEPPVTYDPCVPIHVEINPRTGGADAVSLVEDALGAIQAATGLEFVVDGITDREPWLGAQVRQHDLDQPVLIAWTDPDEVPELAGPAAGVAGSVAVRSGTGERYVTGQVALDGPDLAGLDGAERSAIIRHELGHLVGLGHVDDPRELMFAQTTGTTQWGPGDLAGLALLGSGSCN